MYLFHSQASPRSVVIISCMIHDRSVRVHYENALGMQGLSSTVSPATDWAIEIDPEDHVPLDEPGVKPMPQPVAGAMLQLGGALR